MESLAIYEFLFQNFIKNVEKHKAYCEKVSMLAEANQLFVARDLKGALKFYRQYIETFNSTSFLEGINSLNESNESDMIVKYAEVTIATSEYLELIVKENRITMGKSNILYRKLNKKFGSDLCPREKIKIMERLRLCDVLTSGCYSGKRLLDVAIEQPAYLLSRIINDDSFRVEDFVFLASPLMEQPEYLSACVSNIVKSTWFLHRNNRIETQSYFRPIRPESYGYSSWSEMSFYEAFDGEQEVWDHYNQ